MPLVEKKWLIFLLSKRKVRLNVYRTGKLSTTVENVIYLSSGVEGDQHWTKMIPWYNIKFFQASTVLHAQGADWELGSMLCRRELTLLISLFRRAWRWMPLGHSSKPCRTMLNLLEECYCLCAGRAESAEEFSVERPGPWKASCKETLQGSACQ